MGQSSRSQSFPLRRITHGEIHWYRCPQTSLAVLHPGTRRERLGQGTCGGTRFEIERFAEKVSSPEDEVVLEATSNTWAIVDLLKPKVARVVVSNPMKTRAIASAKIKTDKIDARILAELLRCRFLPEVWQPDPDTRRMRSLTHRRAALVRDRTAVKNRLHSVLAQRLIPVPVSRLFSTQGLQWLRDLELDEDGRFMIDSDLRVLEQIEKEIETLDKRIAELSYPNESVRLLMTLPGVGVTVAQGLLAAWANDPKFPGRPGFEDSTIPDHLEVRHHQPKPASGIWRARNL